MHNNSNVKLNRLFNVNSLQYFDKISTLDVLFGHLRSLRTSPILLTKESIKKLSCLLIDTFINWYRTLPFYSAIDLDLNQFILNNRWSNYIILIIFYFLKINSDHVNLISYEKCLERLCNYTQNTYLSTLTYQIFDQFFHFLSTFINIQMTNTEFTLLSILLIFRSGIFLCSRNFSLDLFDSFLDESTKTNLNSLEQSYFKILHTYEINTFSSEQPYRFNRLLHLSEQIHLITQILITNQHFYLPFLLIPN
jgi:hypothetical protein